MSLTVLMSHQVSLLEPVDLGQHERSKRHATHETRKGHRRALEHADSLKRLYGGIGRLKASRGIEVRALISAVRT